MLGSAISPAAMRRLEGEDRHSFLLRLSDILRTLGDPIAIQGEACRLLAERLQADRAFYCEIDENRNTIKVSRDYVRNSAPSLVGLYPLSDYGWIVPAFREGRQIVIDDSSSSPLIPDDARGALGHLRIAAVIAFPLVKNGRFVASLCVISLTPRQWTPGEIELTRETAERTWATVERAAAEEALRRSEEKYRSLFDSIDEGFCLVEVLYDDAGKPRDYLFLEANPAFENHTGLKDAVGRTIREIAPDPEQEWFKIYGRIAETGIPERFELPAPSLGRYYDVYAFRVGGPEYHRVAILFNDISGRKEAENAIAADLRDTQLLRDLGSRPTSETDVLDLYDAINTAAMKLSHADAGTVQLFDAQPGELVLLAARGFPSGYLQRFARVGASSLPSWRAALDSGERTFLDFDDPAQDDPAGDLRWHLQAGYHSAQSTPLVARSGRPIGMLSTHWRERHHRPTERELRYLDLLARQAADLIEQRQTEASLRAALAASKAAGDAKDHFLAILSHELRTPLSPVVMTTEALQRRTDLDASLRRGLDMIQRNVKLECRLIDDLLDVTRIVRGRLEILREPVDLHQVIRAAIDVSRPDLEKKHQRFTARLDAADARLTGDAARLQQTVWNLLKNASKFTPDGGKIQLSTRDHDGRIIVEIRDNGLGIAPQRLAAIFEAFAQADENVSRRFGGLGLGLAIARATVDAHGGAIRAESDGPGLGSRFTFDLPLSSSSRPSNPVNDLPSVE